MKTEYFSVRILRDDNGSIMRCLGDYDTFEEAKHKYDMTPNTNAEIVYVAIEEERICDKKNGFNKESKYVKFE